MEKPLEKIAINKWRFKLAQIQQQNNNFRPSNKIKRAKSEKNSNCRIRIWRQTRDRLVYICFAHGCPFHNCNTIGADFSAYIRAQVQPYQPASDHYRWCIAGGALINFRTPAGSSMLQFRQTGASLINENLLQILTTWPCCKSRVEASLMRCCWKFPFVKKWMCRSFSRRSFRSRLLLF